MFQIQFHIEIAIADKQPEKLVNEISPLGQQLYIHTVFHTYFYCLCCQSHCFRKQRIGSETKEQSAYMQFCQILKKLLSKDIDSVLFIFKGFFQIGNQTPSTRFQEVWTKAIFTVVQTTDIKITSPCTVFSGFTGRLINSLAIFSFLLFHFYYKFINERENTRFSPLICFLTLPPTVPDKIKKIVFTQRIVRVFYSISEFIENIEFAVLISES